MDIFFILKLFAVVFFLVMFLRNSRIVWGIGLLAVSTAFLLDTIWTTFGREQILADVGFFFYVLAGGLFAGGAIWLWSVLRPFVAWENAQFGSAAPVAGKASLPSPRHNSGYEDGDDSSRRLFEEMRERLSPQDMHDVIFDLQLNENDVLAPDREMTHTAARIVTLAQEQDKMGALALAVERILTPVSPDSLPRREKLTVSSPPTVLRHFLLAHYTLPELIELAENLGVDYQHFDHDNKSELVRNLLLYLQRRNQLHRLIDCLHQEAPTTVDEE